MKLVITLLSIFTFTDSYLMQVGIDWPVGGVYKSRILKLRTDR